MSLSDKLYAIYIPNLSLGIVSDRYPNKMYDSTHHKMY